MYGEDVYSDPQKDGLEITGEIDWDDEPYQFDMTAVWRDPQTGQLYWADDSGCSCPSPFEGCADRGSLTTGTPDELGAHLAARIKSLGEYERGARNVPHVSGAVADLMLRVKTWKAPAASGRQA